MPLSKKQIIVPIVILFTATLVAVLLYINRPQPKHVEITQKPLLVNAVEVVKEDLQITIQAQGTVSPRTATTLIAEVSGKVIEVSHPFKAGGFFKQGDVLLRIDDRDYRAQLKRAEAAVASANSRLATEKGRADVAYKDWLKFRSTVDRSDEATALALRKPQLIEAQANLDSAMADLDHARDQLDRTTIRAPYDGLVRSKSVDIGQFVSGGSKLAETFAVDFAELRLALPENKLSYLNLPDLHGNSAVTDVPMVQLEAEIGGEFSQWQARLVRTEGVLDEQRRVLFAVAEIDDPYGLNNAQLQPLRIGTFVDASIEGRLIADLVALPRYILRAGNRIWIIDDQDRLQNRQVQILHTGGEQVYVTAGLADGERVCLSNISGAIPGTAVRVGSLTRTNNRSSKPPAPEQLPKQQPLNIAPAPAPEAITPSTESTSSQAGDQQA